MPKRFGGVGNNAYLCRQKDIDMQTVRKVVEVTDIPIRTIGGRKLIKRVEKIMMPNGNYRFPVTYIDMTPGFVHITHEELEKNRIAGY
jgi:hypothetical protein